jgi:hypothetical protein
MTTIINCPRCQQGLQLPESLIGHEVQCPSCSRTFTAALSKTSSSPSTYRQETPESRPSNRGSQLPPREEDYPDEIPSRRKIKRKPGKVQAIAIMMLVGGILAIINSLLWLTYEGIFAAASFGMGLLCCLWPGPYYCLVVGIMATVKGSQLIGEKAHLQPAPKAIAIMQIINIVNLDIPNCVMGIISLVFLNEPEVQRYFRE